MSRISSTFGKKSGLKSSSKSLGGQQAPDTFQWTSSLRSPRSSSPGRSRRASGSWTGSLKRSGSKGNLAASFNSSGRLSRSGSQNDLSGVESDYIKNLQQQVYFLELEANHLREQARKATDLHPQMTREAERMLTKLRTLQHEVDGLSLENHRKEANLDFVHTEKERVMERLSEEEIAHNREKRLLMDEIIQLKKDYEAVNRESTRKSAELVTVRDEADRTGNGLRNAEHKIQILRNQLDQRIDQHKMTQVTLDEKRDELVRTESTLREVEDKYYTNTIVLHERALNELREEIRMLRQKLKETEIQADQDRFLRNKISDDSAHLVKENALLNQQVLELNNSIIREKDLRDTSDTRRSQTSTELSYSKEREKKLELELHQTQDALAREQQRVAHYMEQLSKTEHVATSSELDATTTRSRMVELESIHRNTEDNNSQLRRDKALLVDHTADLQRQLSEKEKEVIRLRTHIHTLQNDVAQLEHLKSVENRVHSQKWENLEKMADSMRGLSRSMARSTSPSPRSARSGRLMDY